MTISTATTLPNANTPSPSPNPLNITRGARQFGVLCAEVFIDSELLDDYAAPDAHLGLNAAGVILSVLSSHLAVHPSGAPHEPIHVCLLRRQDGRLVQLALELYRPWGQEPCFQLRKARERNIEVQAEPGIASMNLPAEITPPERWTFSMVDERPGPSVGDAAELIDLLGLDYRSFSSLKLIAESYDGPLSLSQFEVTGPREQINALKHAHARLTRSASMPIRVQPSPLEADPPPP